MENLKDKAIWGVGGGILIGMINLGVFAMKSDVISLEAKMYKEFVTRSEFVQANERTDKKLDKLMDMVSELLKEDRRK